MATTINAGRVAMVPKGEWSASTAYVRLDVVSYHGSSYVCKQDGTGQTPDTATNYWQLLSSGLDPTVDTISAKHYEGSTVTAETSISAAGVISKTASGVTKTYDLPAESGTLAREEETLPNKTYAPLEFSGLGRKYLQKNIVSDKNVLTQAMVSDANTEFIVQYDYDLNDPNGENPITIPANCALKFEGGSINNGKIVFQNTSIESCKECFGDDLVIKGKVLQEASPEWFTGSDADKIEKAINTFGVVKLAARDYLIDRTINVQHSFRLNGCGIPSAFGDYATPSKSDDYSSSRLIPIANISSILACVNPSGIYVSVVLDGVSFMRPTTEAWFSGYKTATANVHGFAFSTPNGPSRPIVIENCNFSRLNYGIYIYDYDTTLDRSTNTCNLNINGCNISNNVQGIHAEGKKPVMEASISNNVIEGNSQYGIYCYNGAGSSFASRGVLTGLVQIESNLLEGQANPIYCSLERGTIIIKGNYLETSNSAGATITIIGRQLASNYQTVILDSNVLSTNIVSAKYDLSSVTLIDNDNDDIKNLTSLSLNNVVIKGTTSKKVKGTTFAYTPAIGNSAQPLLKVRITPTYIDDGKLAYVLQENTGTYVSLTLSASMPAGNYIIVAMSSDLSIMLKKSVSGTTSTLFEMTSMSPSGLNEPRLLELAFTLNDAIPSGGILRVQPSANSNFFSGFAIYADDGNAHYPYSFDPSDYVYSVKGSVLNPKIGFEWYDTSLQKTLRIKDIVSGAAVWTDINGFTPALSRGTTAQRPALTEMKDNGFEYYDTTIHKDISLAFIQGSQTQLAQIKNQQTYKSNPIAEGTYIRIRAMQIKISEGLTGVQFVFCKTNASTDEGIEIPFITLDTSGNGNAYTDYFFAPDPSVYPYIFMKTVYTGYTFFYSIPYTAKWLEADGAVAGVKRSGDTANRPANTDIYTGFQYFDTDLGKYICWNGAAWVNLDGTALS